MCNDLSILVDSKKLLYERVEEIGGEIDKLHKVRNNILLEISKLDITLHQICEHDWYRESYYYAPLRCRICGVEK